MTRLHKFRPKRAKEQRPRKRQAKQRKDGAARLIPKSPLPACAPWRWAGRDQALRLHAGSKLSTNVDPGWCEPSAPFRGQAAEREENNIRVEALIRAHDVEYFPQSRQYVSISVL